MTAKQVDNLDTGLQSGQKPDKKRTRRTAEERHREASEIAGRRYAAELARQAERAAARQHQEDGLDYIAGRDTEGARRFGEEVKRRVAAVKATRTSRRPSHAGVLKAVQSAEDKARAAKRVEIRDAVGDTGTGYTVMKMRKSPVGRLVENKKIGMVEMQAAEQISCGFSALASRVRIKGMTFERVDSGGRKEEIPWSAQVSDAVDKYGVWAAYWSRRRKLLGDPTLEIVIGAIVDETPIRDLAARVERRYATVEQGLIAGLRDFAARSGIVRGALADGYIAEAARVFSSVPEALAEAVHRAAVEI